MPCCQNARGLRCQRVRYEIQLFVWGMDRSFRFHLALAAFGLAVEACSSTLGNPQAENEESVAGVETDPVIKASPDPKPPEPPHQDPVTEKDPGSKTTRASEPNRTVNSQRTTH